MGKLVVAFVFFLAASALAIHEAKPPPPPVAGAAPSVVRHDDDDATPPSRAVHDDVPPWVKYAPPPASAPSRPTASVAASEDIDSAGDVPDEVDRCPDQPTDNDDSDGCPEPPQLRTEIILID